MDHLSDGQARSRILVVDDFAFNVRLLARLLECEQHQVLTASGGLEALDVARRERPDVMLLDVMMPDLSGLEVCRRMKADAELRSIPVILVTARDTEQDVVEGLDAGADDYLVKPIHPQVLSARVRSALRMKREQEAVARINEQLRRTQKLEAVGVLAGGIAHEFNNLLQSISGYAACALEDQPADGQCAADLRMVLKATERATELTRQLLGFSRRKALQPRAVEPLPMLRDLARLLQPLMGESIAVQLTLASDAGRVYADPEEIQQALLNLCLNARDAMPQGGELRLAAQMVSTEEPLTCWHGELPPGDYTELTVTDTGRGIPPRLRERIFEPFFTTKETGKGTGLGLAVVYGIVQQHRGAIRVSSVEGQGATFQIYLPTLAQGLEADTPAYWRAAPGSNETLCAAEDEEVPCQV